MLIIASRNLSKGRMRAGRSYEVTDVEGQALIDAGLARSGETLRERDPALDAELLQRGAQVDFDEIRDGTDVSFDVIKRTGA